MGAIIKEYGQYKVEKNYATALAYGDYSGLDDFDETLVSNFVKHLPKNSIFEFGECIEFTKCDISTAQTDCIELIVSANENDILYLELTNEK